MDAEAGGPALGMARAFRSPPVFAPGLADAPALLGRDIAAADAETPGRRPASGHALALGGAGRADGDGGGTAARHTTAGRAGGRQKEDRVVTRAPAGCSVRWRRDRPRWTGARPPARRRGRSA